MSTSFDAISAHDHAPEATVTLRLSRVFAAPRAAVFRAWTEPDRLAQFERFVRRRCAVPARCASRCFPSCVSSSSLLSTILMSTG